MIREVLGGHCLEVWVSDLFSAQKTHPAADWQVCLAHQLWGGRGVGWKRCGVEEGDQKVNVSILYFAVQTNRLIAYLTHLISYYRLTLITAHASTTLDDKTLRIPEIIPIIQMAASLLMV